MPKKGFTLIEMMIAIFLFMILFLIASAFVNLAAGRTKSVRTKVLTDNARNAMDTITQALNNANGKATIDADTIYGFYLKQFHTVSGDPYHNFLAVVTDDGTGSTKCTFFDRKYNTITLKGYILMATSVCSDFSTWGEVDGMLSAYDPPNGQLMAGADVQVTYFIGDNTSFTDPDSINSISRLEMTDANKDSLLQAPFIQIILKAEDADPKYTADNKITLQTTYTMDYLTIKRLQAQ